VGCGQNRGYDRFIRGCIVNAACDWPSIFHEPNRNEFARSIERIQSPTDRRPSKATACFVADSC